MKVKTIPAWVEVGPVKVKRYDLEQAGWHHEDDCDDWFEADERPEPEPPLYDALAVLGSLHRQAHPSQHPDPLMCREEPCRSLPLDALRGPR